MVAPVYTFYIFFSLSGKYFEKELGQHSVFIFGVLPNKFSTGIDSTRLDSRYASEPCLKILKVVSPKRLCMKLIHGTDPNHSICFLPGFSCSSSGWYGSQAAFLFYTMYPKIGVCVCGCNGDDDAKDCISFSVKCLNRPFWRYFATL